MPCVPPEVDLAGYLPPRGFVAIPLRVNAIGHFEIAVTVEGHAAQFLLDMGASHTVCVARRFRQCSAQSGTAVNSTSVFLAVSFFQPPVFRSGLLHSPP